MSTTETSPSPDIAERLELRPVGDTGSGKTLHAMMTTPVIQGDPEEAFASVVARMHHHRVGSAVITEDGRVVGIVTERDALRVHAGTFETDVRTREVMTAPADCLASDHQPEEALLAMVEHGYRHMPVVDGTTLVGVVSLRDLVAERPLGPLAIPRGLAGVVVADTAVGQVRGNEGFYHYREHSATDLAECRTVEDVWRFVLDAELPATLAEQSQFAGEVRALRGLPEAVEQAIPLIAATGSVLDGMRTTVSLLGAADSMRPLLDLHPDQRRNDALRIAACAPTVAAALYRTTRKLSPIAPRDDLGAGANLLWMLTGEQPDPHRAAALESYLVTTIDHGFNASTFTARVVASTGADMAACVVAAIGALSGPLHGGAPSRALDLLDTIGTADRTDEIVGAMLHRGERIMGFGHAVYRTDDPRSLLLRRIVRDLASHGGPETVSRLLLAERVEHDVLGLLQRHRPDRALRTNVEFYAGLLMEACGIPRELFTPVFVCSRTIGWTAHVLEQAADPKIIRPDARYVGPTPPAAVPLSPTE